MSDGATLAARVDDLARGRVLCVGDVMLDRFVYGAVERVSPEAPIPVLRIEREATMLGGAGNVVRNVSALGGGGVLASAVGEDAAATEIAALVAAEGGIEARLVAVPARRSPIKTRFIAGGQQLLRTDDETVEPLPAPAADEIGAAAVGALAGCDVVVVSDYGKGVVTPALFAALTAAARDAGKPLVVDPKGRDFARYAGAAAITPNRRELAEATGMTTDGDGEIVAAARTLIDACGFGAVLVTRSSDGMTLVTADRAEHLPAQAREVFDVSGAGDTVVATFALALAAGMPMRAAAELANAAAGIVVGKVGTAAAYASDLARTLHAGELRLQNAKLMPAAPAADAIEAWRRRGARIGFTNGCFDLLHPGHVSLLRQARAACDRLVVGLNSDESVRSLKGPNRPVQSESARALVLASLEMVDLVVIFGEPTPESLIARFRPDILVKGADYRLDQVVGADLVRSYGGQVILADLVAGHSTSATIARLPG